MTGCGELASELIQAGLVDELLSWIRLRIQGVGTRRYEAAIDIGGGHDAIAGLGQRRQPVADPELQVAEDLVPVGIAAQANGGPVEIALEPVIGARLEPKALRVALQADEDRLV